MLNPIPYIYFSGGETLGGAYTGNYMTGVLAVLLTYSQL